MKIGSNNTFFQNENSILKSTLKIIEKSANHLFRLHLGIEAEPIQDDPGACLGRVSVNVF